MATITRPVETDFEVIFNWLVLTTALTFILLGLGGIIMVITSHNSESDSLMEFAYAFSYSYMMVVGFFLIIYRKKLIVKRYHKTY